MKIHFLKMPSDVDRDANNHTPQTLGEIFVCVCYVSGGKKNNIGHCINIRLEKFSNIEISIALAYPISARLPQEHRTIYLNVFS